MKLKVVLAVAILLDVLFAGIIVHLLNGKGVQQIQESPVATAEQSGTQPPTPEPRVPAAVTNLPAQTFNWRSIESEDYRKYIANLRGIGCPEETIRDIIVADVNKLFDSRKKELRKQAGEFKFWKSGQPTLAGLDPDRLKQDQELAREKREVLKELLGVDVPEAQDLMARATNPLGDMLDFLPTDKQAKTLGIMQELQAKMLQATGNRSGQPGTNDVPKIKAVMDEYNAALGQFLTPAEKEQLDLTLSQTAQNMRSQLGAFNSTEQEFREIFKIRKKFDDEFQPSGRASDPAGTDRREAAFFESERQIRQLLGDARYNEYRNSRDFVPNTPLRQIAEAEGIPNERATQVLEIRDTAREQALKIRTDAALSGAQREVTLATIQTQTRNAITGVLGEKAATAYFEKPVAKRWIDGLGPARGKQEP
jgi:hypothetical protein